jgi:hypothetical protein
VILFSKIIKTFNGSKNNKKKLVSSYINKNWYKNFEFNSKLPWRKLYEINENIFDSPSSNKYKSRINI